MSAAEAEVAAGLAAESDLFTITGPGEICILCSDPLDPGSVALFARLDGRPGCAHEDCADEASGDSQGSEVLPRSGDTLAWEPVLLTSAAAGSVQGPRQVSRQPYAPSDSPATAEMERPQG